MSQSCGQETELMNIETAHHHEEDKMRVLYEASYKGYVSTLNSLLQEDPGLLYKISSQTIFIETPLHISASHGHLEFTKTLLAHKPGLALERNSSQSTPLHLASAEGHIDIVNLLLEAREEACLVLDQEGRIPLHYAVIRGRKDVVLALINSKPESLKILDDMGKTIFHLCVTYNQLEILKDLVKKLDTHGTHELLIKGDLDGKNTILHLATMLRQVETARYLISIPRIRSEVSSLKNDMGYTAADIVERIPRDSRSLEIQAILMQQCGIYFENFGKVAAAREEGGDRPSYLNPLINNVLQWLPLINAQQRMPFVNVLRWMQKLVLGDGEWVSQMRANLSLVPTIVATITFQAAVNPPGGVIQQNILNSGDNKNVTSSTYHDTWLYKGPLGCLPYNGYVYDQLCPGDAILAHTQAYDFNRFMIFNTISFVASLILAFLLLSGIPLKSRSMMWVLNLGMLSNLSFLLNAYFASINLIAPTVGLGHAYDRTIQVITWTLNAFCMVVAAFIVLMRLVGPHKKRNTSR